MAVVEMPQPLLKTPAQQPELASPVAAIPSGAAVAAIVFLAGDPQPGPARVAKQRLGARHGPATFPSPISPKPSSSSPCRVLTPCPVPQPRPQLPATAQPAQGAHPSPGPRAPIRAISYFFLNAPEPPVCFFNCSNHKREVSERREPGSAGKGERWRSSCMPPPPPHRNPGASAARPGPEPPSPHPAVPSSSPFPMPLTLIPSSLRGDEFGACSSAG